MWLSGRSRLAYRVILSQQRTCTQSTRAVRFFAASSQKRKSSVNVVKAQEYPIDHMTNVTPAILEKVDRQLLHMENHPLRIIKNIIENFFSAQEGLGYEFFDNENPVVTVEQNFDSLLVPSDHVSRQRNDNYYLNGNHLLRAHTSAHQRDFMQLQRFRFLLSADVYRRDEIDRSHYPVFHQMEGVYLFSPDEMQHTLGLSKEDCELVVSGTQADQHQAQHSTAMATAIGDHLKETLAGLATHLFGPEAEVRWVEAYFPFTHPSWEMEVFFEGEWLEVLGCGVVQQPIIKNASVEHHAGWAFGLGLERLAMVLFDIPDIRLFWSTDERFLRQFNERNPELTKFKPFSKYPPCPKDISFWIPAEFSPNSFYDHVRNVAGDLVEEITLVDEFNHPKTNRTSHTYRLTYRASDRNLTNAEVNTLQEIVRAEAAELLGVELRHCAPAGFTFRLDMKIQSAATRVILSVRGDGITTPFLTVHALIALKPKIFRLCATQSTESSRRGLLGPANFGNIVVFR